MFDMAGSCNQTITDGVTNSAETKISANGQVRTYVKRKPYYPAGYVPSSVSVINPSQLTVNTLKGIDTSVAASLDPNVLLETSDGLAVLVGKTNSLLLFKDAASGEIKGDVIAVPAPIKTNPCDSEQPNRNAFRVTTEGCVVLTQSIPSGIDVSQCNGAFTYVDCASGELRVHIQVAPEVLGNNCAPLLDQNGKVIKKNALVCTPAGLAVLSGKSESIETYLDCESGEFRARLVVKKDNGCDTAENRGVNALIVTAEGAQVLTGKNAKGGVNTFVDCVSGELLGEIVIKPAPDNSTCEFNPNPNALRRFDDGLAVLTGKNVAGGVETFVDCATQEIHAKIILKPDPVAAKCDPTVLTNALRSTPEGLAVEVADTSCIALNIDCSTGILSAVPKFGAASSAVLGCADDGIVMKLSAVPGNLLKIQPDGLYAADATEVAFFGAFRSTPDIFQNSPSTHEGQVVSWSWVNNTGKLLWGFLHFRAPSGAVSFSAGEFYLGYNGTYNSSLGADGVGDQYVAIPGGVQQGYSFTGANEIRPIQVNPGDTFSASMKISAKFENQGSTNGGCTLNSYGILAILYTVQGRINNT